MNTTASKPTDRLLELLADRATEGLAANESSELEQLLLAHPDVDPDSFDRAAGALDAAWAAIAPEKMPAGVRKQLGERGREFLGRAGAGTVSELSVHRERKAREIGEVAKKRSLINRESAGWFAAAAALVAAIFVARPGVDAPVTFPTVAKSSDEFRSELLAQPETVTIAWQPPTEAGYENVSGDVVWNNETQSGFMRLVGLPVNDSAQAQYQLWIVDPARDERPVDGGVFDVASTGEVIVPIDPKLDIIEPAAFAITLEKPGGVVVSAGPLLVVAAVET